MIRTKSQTFYLVINTLGLAVALGLGSWNAAGQDTNPDCPGDRKAIKEAIDQIASVSERVGRLQYRIDKMIGTAEQYKADKETIKNDRETIEEAKKKLDKLLEGLCGCCEEIFLGGHSTPVVEAPRVPARLENSATGYNVDIKTPPGLDTFVFTTPRNGRFEGYFPDHVYPGRPFFGTLRITNAGDGSKGRNDLFLDVGGQTLPIKDGPFNLTIPAGTKEDTTKLMLLDNKHKLLTGAYIPLYRMPEDPTRNVHVPKSGTSGGLLVFNGPFGGGVRPSDFVKIGGKEAQILAASEGMLVALDTFDVPGMTQLTASIGGWHSETPFRNLKVTVTADATSLLKGQHTTVHILVSGLAGIKNPAAMTITSSGPVSLEGGGSQKGSISPEQVGAGGTFSKDLGLSAIEKGDFGVVVIVALDEDPEPENPRTEEISLNNPYSGELASKREARDKARKACAGCFGDEVTREWINKNINPDKRDAVEKQAKKLAAANKKLAEAQAAFDAADKAASDAEKANTALDKTLTNVEAALARAKKAGNGDETDRLTGEKARLDKLYKSDSDKLSKLKQARVDAEKLLNEASAARFAEAKLYGELCKSGMTQKVIDNCERLAKIWDDANMEYLKVKDAFDKWNKEHGTM